jgi:hypothetical protein
MGGRTNERTNEGSHRLLVNIKARVKALVKARPGDKGLARLFPGEGAVTQPQSARLHARKARDTPLFAAWLRRDVA